MSGRWVTFLLVRPDLTPRWQAFASLSREMGARVRVVAPAGDRAMDTADVTERIAIEVTGRGHGWRYRLRVAAAVRRATRRMRSDVWVVTHPALLQGAGRLDGKLVYEIAEFWEFELRSRLGWLADLVAPLWERWEARHARGADLITMVDSKDGWLAARYRALGTPVEVVFNAPSLRDDAEPVNDVTGKIRLIHVGGLRRAKGLERMLVLLAQCANAGLETELMLIGPLLEDETWYRRTVEELGITERVLRLGPLPYRALQRHIRDAGVGLALNAETELYRRTGLGNGRKLFTYLQAGIPVVIAEHMAGAELIEQRRCGTVVRGNGEALFAAVAPYLENPAKVAEEGARARSAFENEFSWEMHSQALRRRLEALVA